LATSNTLLATFELLLATSNALLATFHHQPAIPAAYEIQTLDKNKRGAS